MHTHTHTHTHTYCSSDVDFVSELIVSEHMADGRAFSSLRKVSTNVCLCVYVCLFVEVCLHEYKYTDMNMHTGIA